MTGLGTVINVVGILIGGLLGMFFGSFLIDRFRKILIVAMALSIISMSISGIVSKMLITDGNSFSTKGTYILIFSLVLGSICGELLNIEAVLSRFGTFLQKKAGQSSDQRFLDGFLSASLTVCIGAMAIVGSVMDGIKGDYSILLTKGIMDAIIILVMTSSYGKGCIFSAIPVGIFQGTLTIISRLIAPVLTENAISNISLTGSVLILCIGINLISDGKFKIKVANFLPSLLFAVVASYIPILQ